MTVHKCFKCKKVYDCKNEAVITVNEAFFAKLYGFESKIEMNKAGFELIEPRCNETYEAACPYCAFKVIFNEEYDPKV